MIAIFLRQGYNSILCGVGIIELNSEKKETMDIFNTWKFFKNPESLKKLAYVIAFFCAITLLVSIVCGIASYSEENKKFDRNRVFNKTYNEKVSKCKLIPPHCKEKKQSSFKCKKLPDGWSFLGLFCITDECIVKKKCFDDQENEPERAKACQKKHYDTCVEGARIFATQKVDELQEKAKSNSFNVGMDKGINTAFYFVLALVSILVFIFIAMPIIKNGGKLAIKGTKTGASMANQVIRDRIQYGDGFDYQFYKLLFALQIKILKKLGPISELQMTVMRMLYEKNDYKSAEFHSRFTQLLSDESDLDLNIKNVRIAILEQNELKVSIIEFLLTFAFACGYDEHMEYYIRYVADNLSLDKNVYIVIRDSMLKYVSKTPYDNLDVLFDGLELNLIFSKKEFLQFSKMDLDATQPSMNKAYSKEFFRFVFPLLVKLSYADGSLDFNKINHLNNFYSSCGYAKSEFLRLLKSYLADGRSFYFHVMNLKQYTQGQKKFRIHALENVILYANFIGSPQTQLDMIENMSKELDVGKNSFATLKNKFSSQSDDSTTLVASLRAANKQLIL